MKIAIVTPVFPPYRGGIGSAAYREARDLASRGHTVTVYTPKRKAFVAATADGFSLYYLRPFLKYGNAAFLPQLFWKLKNFDVVHLHYPFFGGAEVAWRCKLKFKILNLKSKLIITYHHDVVGKGWIGKFFKWHTKNLMPKILEAADKIIVSSFDYAKNSNIKSIFEKYPEKFVEVPFGVDTKKFQPATKDDQLFKKYSLTMDNKIVLFVGGLDKAHYFKGLETLINSKVQISNSKLLIVGDGELKSHYEKMAADLKIQDQVIFTSAIEINELPKYYNLADVLVLPSVDKSEAFGIVLIEAMSCGKPVIASNLPGVRSVVNNGENGFLVEPKNVDQLAEKISYILNNPDIAKQFGEYGRRKVLEKYDMQNVGKKLEQILLNCYIVY